MERSLNSPSPSRPGTVSTHYNMMSNSPFPQSERLEGSPALSSSSIYSPSLSRKSTSNTILNHRILIYLLRRDLRFADNPILHECSKSAQQPHQPYTHLLPLYIFPAQQLEVSGFLSSESKGSPFPEARSQAGGFWRCGPHRAKFLAESVWDLKESLEGANSGLTIRVGMVGQVVRDMLDAYKKDSSKGEVVSLWMTSEEGVEEQREERDVRKAVESEGKNFRIWTDEKYYIDEYAYVFSRSKGRNQLKHLQPRCPLSKPL